MKNAKHIAGVLALVVGLLALVWFAGGPAGNIPVQTLGPDAAALRAAFNGDAGKVRIVMLVDPT